MFFASSIYPIQEIRAGGFCGFESVIEASFPYDRSFTGARNRVFGGQKMKELARVLLISGVIVGLVLLTVALFLRT